MDVAFVLLAKRVANHSQPAQQFRLARPARFPRKRQEKRSRFGEAFFDRLDIVFRLLHAFSTNGHGLQNDECSP